jgi:CheY-like chemotaxis protein
MPLMVLIGDGKRVLVVEDDDDIRSALAELLESEGYEVTSAADGRQGIERALARPPDVILLDLMMPVMNGWEFREEQKRDPTIAGVPVVVVSAVSRASIDASEVIAKPFSIDDVLAAVERHSRAA